MTTGLTYATFVTQLAKLAVVSSDTDTNFQLILPSAITYAENRMCRDIDFLSMFQTNSSFSLATGNRNLSIGTQTSIPFVTIQEINVITPAGTTDPELGTRIALIPVSKEFLNFTYNSVVGASTPSYFAMLNQYTLLVGPWPDAGYTVELVGTIRPDSLSATNSPTFISTYLPDLMLAAAMVYVTGYQRDFGAQASDPQAAQSWENQYQTLLKGALVEEARKKFAASGWTSLSPPVVATPSRG